MVRRVLSEVEHGAVNEQSITLLCLKATKIQAPTELLMESAMEGPSASVICACTAEVNAGSDAW